MLGVLRRAPLVRLDQRLPEVLSRFGDLADLVVGAGGDGDRGVARGKPSHGLDHRGERTHDADPHQEEGHHEPDDRGGGGDDDQEHQAEGLVLLGGVGGFLGELRDLQQQGLELVVELFLLDLDRFGALDGLDYLARREQLGRMLDVLLVIGVLDLDLLQRAQDVLEFLSRRLSLRVFDRSLGELLGVHDLHVHHMGELLEEMEGLGEARARRLVVLHLLAIAQQALEVDRLLERMDGDLRDRGG